MTVAFPIKEIVAKPGAFTPEVIRRVLLQAGLDLTRPIRRGYDRQLEAVTLTGDPRPTTARNGHRTVTA